MLNSKKLLRQAGVEWTDIERKTKNRKEWKRRVREWMKRMYVWENYMWHKYKWSEEDGRDERSEYVVVEEAEDDAY